MKKIKISLANGIILFLLIFILLVGLVQNIFHLHMSGYKIIFLGIIFFVLFLLGYIPGKKNKRRKQNDIVTLYDANTEGDSDEERFANMTREILATQGISLAGMNHNSLCATIANNFESLKYSYVINKKDIFYCGNTEKFISDVATLMLRKL